MAFDLSGYSILVVDDFRDMRIAVCSMLEYMGAVNVREARNGMEALEQIRAFPFDVILCDYNLGEGKDGQQVFEEARALGLLAPKNAYVMITAESTMGAVMAVAEHHPDGYIVKPFNKAAVQVRLRRILIRNDALKDVQHAINVRDYAVALELVEERLAQFPKLKFDLLHLKAEAMLSSGDFDSCVEISANILAERRVPWAMFTMGKALYLLGDPTQARAMFKEITEQMTSIMEAYDWLARIDRELDGEEAAQVTLMKAVDACPRSLKRQQALADVALMNGDLEVARKAFNKSVTIGENSYFSRPDDVAGLVNTIAATQGNDKAMKKLRELNKLSARKKENRHKQRHWRVYLVEAKLLHAAGKADEAETSLRKALAGYEKDDAPMDAQAVMDLAKTCFEHELIDEGNSLMEKIVRENHDNKTVIDRAKSLFMEVGMEADGARLVDDACQAIIDINNEGVRQSQQGNLDEGLETLIAAANELPSNVTISLNVVQAVINQIKRRGVNEQRISIAREFLERVEKRDQMNGKATRLRNQLNDCLRRADSVAMA